MRLSLAAACRAVVALGFIGSAIACGKASADDKGPALSKPAAQASAVPAFVSSASPGQVPCGAETCVATKHSRKVCCNAPGVPATCKYADKCGQATKFRYTGMLSCNETADCTAIDKGRDVVCCLSDDGFKAEGTTGPYNRASCMPRAACAGSDALACVTDAECPKGTTCKQVGMGSGITLGGCLP